MGRTVPTFTQVILQEMESWTKFRRGLRREDQEALDELFRAARMQLAGSAYAARTIPFESMIMAMLIMQQRMIRTLRDQRGIPGHDTANDTGDGAPPSLSTLS
jgi:hypothetical protein